jgi:uroporphyrinogen decarboxylase
METPRERMLKAINHIQPEQVPLHVMAFDPIDPWLDHFGVADYVDLRQKLGLDIQAARVVHTGPGVELGIDIWGKSAGSGGADGAGYGSTRGAYPLAEATSVAEVDRFDWPDPDDFDYAVAAEVLRSIPGDVARWAKMQYATAGAGQTHWHAARMGGQWIPLLCSLFDLFGMEAAMLHLHGNPGLIEAAVAHIEEFSLEFERRMLDATAGLVDIFHYGDDFATQNGMMISPEHWRRFLKPTYQRIYGLAKDRGLGVWVHSCGQFRPVIRDMIDIGMDVWEPAQVHLAGNEPEVLKREYGMDLAFDGAVSTQRTLPSGTPDEVRAEVQERIRVLGAGGGYICGGDHSILGDVPIENVLAMLDEARRFRF